MTLIKPPCTNDGKTPNPAANAYLASLLAGNAAVSKSKTSSFMIISKITASKLKQQPELMNKLWLKNILTGETYTPAFVYQVCLEINNGTALSFEEWDGFLEDLQNYLRTCYTKASLSYIIREMLEYDAEAELQAVVFGHESFNEEAYNNVKLRNNAIEDIKELIKYNPFVRLAVEIPAIAYSYSILEDEEA